jgi:hypothetical protein
MAQKKRITLSTARARKRFVQTLENSVIKWGETGRQVGNMAKILMSLAAANAEIPFR